MSARHWDSLYCWVTLPLLLVCVPFVCMEALLDEGRFLVRKWAEARDRSQP